MEPVDLATKPPPPSVPPSIAADAHRDMAGNALSERTKPRGGKAECTLASTRNIFRDDSLSREWLALRQHMTRGVIEHGVPGRPHGEIGFPDWPHIVENLRRPGEEVVKFNPKRLGTSELILDVRVGVLYTVHPPHVIAFFSEQKAHNPHVRVYDNESHARRIGQPTLQKPRSLWRECCVVGVAASTSPLCVAILRNPDHDVRVVGFADLTG